MRATTTIGPYKHGGFTKAKHRFHQGNKRCLGEMGSKQLARQMAAFDLGCALRDGVIITIIPVIRRLPGRHFEIDRNFHHLPYCNIFRSI